MKKEIDFGKRLAYGCLRLPIVEAGFVAPGFRDDSNVDEAAWQKIVDRGMANGYNYFDTSWFYHNGNSERAIGHCVADRYPRESFILSDKMPVKFMKDGSEMEPIFEEQLKKCHVDYFDFYLIHAISSETYDKWTKEGLFDFLVKKREEGKYREFGLSLHETPEFLDRILTEHPEVDFVMLQINYLDWDDPTVQSGRLYETVRKHNKPFTIMEPNKGGWLASTASDVGKLLKSANPDVSVASWAFRFVLGLEGLFVCLSGMGNVQEVEDNIHTFKNYKPLSEEEHGLLKQAVDIIRATPNIPCTGCGYCAPNCPKKIVIPGFMNLYNNYLKHKNLDTIKHIHNMCTMGDNGRPADCVQCGACEKHCPQHLEIRKVMSEVARIVGEG